MKLWVSETGEEVLTLTGHADEITAVAFSPDGRTLATATRHGPVKLWRAATESEAVAQHKNPLLPRDVIVPTIETARTNRLSSSWVMRSGDLCNV